MNKDWKFTWEVEINGKSYQQETDKNFDAFIHLRPFVLKIRETDGDREFYFPVQIGQKPVFFRKVFGRCGLNHMMNEVVEIINCFGVEADDGKSSKNIVWECNDKYYFVDDISKYVRLG